MKGVWLCMTLASLNVIGVLGLGNVNTEHVYTIEEEQRSGTFIGNVARDTRLYEKFSQEQSQWLRYSVSNQGSANFRINATSSALWTQDVINREEVCPEKVKCEQRCDVNVYLENSETGHQTLEMIVRVTVVITDTNDNSPEFPELSVSLTVPESIKVGGSLITSPANDLDTMAEHSVQSYTIVPDDGIFELKLVNSAGISDLKIVIKKSLDRETRDSYQFVIVAKDGGNPPKSGSVSVTITVMDVNDNIPTFTKVIFEVMVDENIPINKAILTLEADDKDIGVNGNMSFHFGSRASTKVRSYFSIDEHTGKISPIKKLDYEDETEHRFPVEVKDKGSLVLSSVAEVVVKVADVNDNSPQVLVNIPGGVRKVSEDAENNTVIVHVNVDDADSGENGHVTCTVNDRHFHVEKFTGRYYKIILREKLDFEEKQTFSLNITCRDNGTIPRTNSTSFTVQVLDVNDNSPTFTKENITAFITENNDKDQLITTVTARDEDGDGNNDISYAIIDGSIDLAYINKNTGEIRAKDVIDRERISSFTLKIEARDNGSPAMSSFATVTVVVDDVNDHSPEFTKALFKFEVPEGRPISTLVGKLNAIDDDASPRFLFSLVNEDVTDIFTISSTSGEIITRRNLDRLVRDRYHFTVKVMDAEELSFYDTANVTVYVIEDRSTPPVILFPKKGNNSVSIPFDSAVGSVILMVKTENRSSTEIRNIKYVIEHGNEDKFFHLDEDSGSLTLVKAVYLKDAGTYKLLISTYYENNLGQKSFVTVDIVISSSAKDDEDKNNYIVIVIVIVCVTVTLGCAIMLAICLMKKVDRERRESRRKRFEAVEKVYHVDNIETIAGVSDWAKEDSRHVMVKPQLSFKEEKIQEKHSQKDAVSPKPTTINQKKIVQFAGDTKLKVEDDISNLSAEADSGHGGSEEDFNSNGRHLFLRTDSDSPQQHSPSESFEFRPETSILSTSSLREWLVETPRTSLPPPPPPPLPPLPPNSRIPQPNCLIPNSDIQSQRLLRHVSENLPRTFSPSAAGARPRSLTPVTDVYHLRRDTSCDSSTCPERNPPTRKSSTKSGQKSVRFNIDGADNGTSNT